MPKHHIEISLPTKPLKNVDTTITVWSDNEKLGVLYISRGSLDWRSGGKRTVKSIAWERLAELLDGE